MTVALEDGTQRVIDCKDMTGDQMDLLLSADEHATRRIIVSEPAPVRPSRAMKRVSQRHSEMQPNLSQLPDLPPPADFEASSSARQRRSSFSFGCVADFPPFCWTLDGCSVFTRKSSSESGDDGDGLSC